MQVRRSAGHEIGQWAPRVSCRNSACFRTKIRGEIVQVSPAMRPPCVNAPSLAPHSRPPLRDFSPYSWHVSELAAGTKCRVDGGRRAVHRMPPLRYASGDCATLVPSMPTVRDHGHDRSTAPGSPPSRPAPRTSSTPARAAVAFVAPEKARVFVDRFPWLPPDTGGREPVRSAHLARSVIGPDGLFLRGGEGNGQPVVQGRGDRVQQGDGRQILAGPE